MNTSRDGNKNIQNSNSSSSSTGDISQTVNVNTPGTSKLVIFASIAIPIIAAIVGAYANRYLALKMAPENTAHETLTLVGELKNLNELATSKKVDPDVLKVINQLEDKARAVEVNLSLLEKQAGVSSNQANLWLRMNNGAILGRTTSFGVTGEYANGVLIIRVNEKQQFMPAGGKVNFKTEQGKECFITYTGKSTDGKLYGFRTECPNNVN